MSEDSIVDISVSAMGESYARFRLAHSGAEGLVLESVRQFGQILPVVVVSAAQGYELIDGFKRLRACRKLGIRTIQAKVLCLGERPVKAAILQLNWKARSIRELEEALIVRSLHREDNLSQVQIATLLGRHKSWVCRRIGLVERLCGEALSHLKLGLIGPGHGRQLVRLPRGNQESALETILKHRLCSREAEKLVSMLLERPRWEHEAILHLPLEILDNRSAARSCRKPEAAEHQEPSLTKRLRDLAQHCRTLLLILDSRDLDPPDARELEILPTTIESVAKLLDRMKSFCAMSSQ